MDPRLLGLGVILERLAEPQLDLGIALPSLGALDLVERESVLTASRARPSSRCARESVGSRALGQRFAIRRPIFPASSLEPVSAGGRLDRALRRAQPDVVQHQLVAFEAEAALAVDIIR